MSYAPPVRARPPGAACLTSLRDRLLAVDHALASASEAGPLLGRAAALARCADPDPGHTARVASLAAGLAADLGWLPADAQDLACAAGFHDVGKCALPRSLMNFPGPLSPAHRRQLVVHTLVATWLLGSARYPVLRLAAVVGRSHHERWDGHGYPDGTRARKIPFAARIVTAADIWDALTHDRPYRAALPTDEAATLVQGMRERALDPDVMDALLRRVA